jgi:nitronate monooxygenase
MDVSKMPTLNIGNLAIKVPIIQGGMGVGISLANLASAVSNEGGIGVISSIGLGLLYPKSGSTYFDANKIAVQNEIRKARKLTDGVLGINIMVAITDFDDIVKVALEEEIDIIFIGAGLPLKIPQNLSLEYLLKSKTKIVPIVSSARAAKIIFNSWDKKYNHVPDAVVLEGPLAGGHLGFKTQQINDPNYTLENLLPDLLEIISLYEEKFNKQIPVIVAGGIYSGKDIHKFLKLGASGVQLGTRFVATDECDASMDFKKQFMDCSIDEIGIIESPVGLPGRGIINDFLKDVSSGIRKPYKCPFKCLKTCDYQNAPYCIALALVNAKNGKLENGFAFCGSNAFKIESIISVKKLMADLQKEYETEALLNQGESLKDLHKVI